ncbi:HlyD family efflux transporter periplasmic adaptor subunit [uncultured Bacteroides sp.]|uniref:HlyD family secretion protein n=1 Tax=uncultured Bacteroides sp. TaxID=162156 RepID=UPI0025FF1DFA|nr:HlyD family efflux transporter periplasmic adaptor subunit [uncultured Bacteroides sp.]
MENRKPEIELRSEEFNEVLSAVPAWIVRWGITVIACVVLMLLVGSAVFKYPDVISSTVTLTGTTPVSAVVARTSGKLQELYVGNNQQVKANTLLAVIENPAGTNDILRLKELLRQAENSLDTIALVPSQQLRLGSLQSLYSSFYLSMSEYRQFKELAYHLKKIDLVKTRIVKNEVYYRNMLKQKDLSAVQAKIAHQQYARDSLLGVKGLVSKEAVEESYSRYLQSSLSAENMERSLENLQIQLAQMNESLYDTEYQYLDQKNTLETQLRSLVNQLRAEIDAWEINYALITPIDGEITLTQYWTNNQNVTAGNVVFNIVPSNQGEIIGKAMLPTERSGKVKKGQKVNIRFSNYPDKEFGIVKGIVENISLIPVLDGQNAKSYMVDIQLPNGLRTSYNKDLPFLPEMEGQADIITEDISLLERFLMPIRKVITEGLKSEDM